MILLWYGERNRQDALRYLADVDSRGVDMARLADLAEQWGLTARGIALPVSAPLDIPLPAIAHVDGSHFVVVVDVNGTSIGVADPVRGSERLEYREFWSRSNGVFLLLIPRGAVGPSQTANVRIGELEKRSRIALRAAYRPVLRELRSTIWGTLLLTLAICVLSLAYPIVLQRIIDALQAATRPEWFSLAVPILLSVGVVQLCLGSLRSHFLTRAAATWEASFVSRAMRHYLAITPSLLERYSKEEFLARLQANRGFRQLFSSGALDALFDVVLIGAYIFALFRYHAVFGMIGGLGVLLLSLLYVLYLPMLREDNWRVFQTDSAVTGSMIDTLSGVLTIKTLTAEEGRFRHWKVRLERALMSGVNSNRTHRTLGAGSGVIVLALSTSIMGSGLMLLNRGAITQGVLVASILISSIVFAKTQGVHSTFLNVHDLFTDLMRIKDLLLLGTEQETHSLGAVAPTNSDGERIGGSLTVTNLSYRFPSSERDCLHNISLRFEPGSFTAIVGRNGSGKSTLLRLLAGLYRDHGGRITLGNASSTDINVSLWRQSVALVLQDTYLFTGTLLENLMLANPRAQARELSSACELAGLIDVGPGRSLPLSHHIRNGGANLSGGQRLRVAIARLFLTAPRVILLDESTSALDPESEREILANLRRHFADRVLIAASHRLNTIVQSERVVVLENGNVVEDGVARDLVEQGGVFASLSGAFTGER